MRSIWITTQFEGTHAWPECPDNLNGVAFLRNEHRHTFKVKVEIEVEHNDRAIEFFVFQEFINNTIADIYGGECMPAVPLYRLGRKSCEDICEDLIIAIKKSQFGSRRLPGTDRDGYPLVETRTFMVEVSEDGEVGARYKA